jgi:hypothetical protein
LFPIPLLGAPAVLVSPFSRQWLATRRVVGGRCPARRLRFLDDEHLSYFAFSVRRNLSVRYQFCRRRKTSADRNLRHHIEPSENRSIGETQRMCHHCAPSSSPPFQGVVVACAHHPNLVLPFIFIFSLLALLRPRLGGIEFGCQERVQPMQSFSLR